MRDFALESLMLRSEIHQMIWFTPTLDNKRVLANPSVVSLDATIQKELQRLSCHVVEHRDVDGSQTDWQ